MEFNDVFRLATASGMKMNEDTTWSAGPAEMHNFQRMMQEELAQEQRMKRPSNTWDIWNDEVE